MASFLYRPMNDSAAALSSASPTVPIDADSPYRARVSVNRIEVYCLGSRSRSNTGLLE